MGLTGSLTPTVSVISAAARGAVRKFITPTQAQFPRSFLGSKPSADFAGALLHTCKSHNCPDSKPKVGPGKILETKITRSGLYAHESEHETNFMKTSNDPIVHGATETTAASASCGKPAGSTGLKLLLTITSVTAAWLAYRAVNETFALHRWMDEAAERIAAKPVMWSSPKNMSAHPDSKTSETNRLSAVLSN